MANRLLETKFHIPATRTADVPRPRLLEILQAGLTENRKLTLVSAPAGYGKTSLVAEWIQAMVENSRVTWLSLEESDNDPARFLGYWIAAFCRVNEILGQSAQSLLGMPQIPPSAAILDELINELAALETQVILVLDDYHVIFNQGIHDAMEYFIEHQPAQVHLVITTRIDPPLSLSRLRARAQMTEIRAHDLRFTLEEARQFFNQSMRLRLTDEAIGALEARTEGWVAGLQLAALALQNLPDQQDFLADFSGSHRYVIDYLLDEVLKHQPPEIREFLSQTALLERFNAELCQAVTGNPASASVLTKLELSNLFLIPLDDQRGWYRYHHLFADVLRTGLTPKTEREIRTRAAEWFERQGLFAEAISIWLAVPEMKQASRLIARTAVGFLKNGELQTLIGWLNALPDSVVNQNPDLVSYKALSLLMTGQISLAREYAAQAYETFAGQPPTAGHGRLFAMQAWFAMTRGDAHTGELAQAALEYLDETDLFFRAFSLIALGTSYAWDADLPASSQIFRQAHQLSRQMNHSFLAMGALANLAFNLWELGNLREAEALCRSAVAEYVDSRARPLPILGIIYLPLAAICYEKGDFDEAQAFAQRGGELCHRLFSNAIAGGDSEIILARVAFERGDAKQALDLLRAFAQSARQRDIMMVVFKMAVVQTELHLLQGNLPEAAARLKELEALVQSNLPKSEQLVAHLQARYWVAHDQPQKALQILDRLEQADRDEGCLRRLMGVHLTQALAYQLQGDHDRAIHAIGSALRLAAPEGYRTLFFPHPGRPIRPLLKSARAIAPDFVDSILKTHPAAEENASPFSALPDPLSEQEIRVLKLVVAGKRNHEVANELFISVGTAKWHVHNILQKLGVNNRPQAIARARELGLV